MKAKPTEDPKQLIDDFAHGIEEKHYTSVVLTSKNFVVFKIKGHSAWACVACPFEYVRTQYILIRRGDWWLSNGVVTRRWEGRVSKKELAEALTQSEVRKAVYQHDIF